MFKVLRHVWKEWKEFSESSNSIQYWMERYDDMIEVMQERTQQEADTKHQLMCMYKDMEGDRRSLQLETQKARDSLALIESLRGELKTKLLCESEIIEEAHQLSISIVEPMESEWVGSMLFNND